MLEKAKLYREQRFVVGLGGNRERLQLGMMEMF